jgi:hypothetical protein
MRTYLILLDQLLFFTLLLNDAVGDNLINEHEAFGGMLIGRGNSTTRRKSAPVPHPDKIILIKHGKEHRLYTGLIWLPFLNFQLLI